MAENFIQVPPNSSGEKVRSFKNTIGLNDVNSQATTITDKAGNIMSDLDGSGRIQVNASGVPVPITDNAGSLTIDAPVSTPAFVRLSDGATAIANLAVNQTQMNGIAVSAGSGASGTGTQRVILATDQPVIPISDNAGSLTVDNSGTFAVQDSQKIADNGLFVDGTTPVNPVGYILDEVAGTALSENDIAAARIDSKRAIINVIEDGTVRGRRAAVTAANELRVYDSHGSSVLVIEVAGTYVLKAGSGVLRRIILGSVANGGTKTIVAYDNTVASGTKLAQASTDTAKAIFNQSLEFHVAFTTGLTVVVPDASSVTVVFD